MSDHIIAQNSEQIRVLAQAGEKAIESLAEFVKRELSACLQIKEKAPGSLTLGYFGLTLILRVEIVVECLGDKPGFGFSPVIAAYTHTYEARPNGTPIEKGLASCIFNSQGSIKYSDGRTNGAVGPEFASNFLMQVFESAAAFGMQLRPGAAHLGQTTAANTPPGQVA